MRDYRTRTYQEYASYVQGLGEQFDAEAAARFARGYAYYLRDWLPDDSSAHISELACGSGRLLYLLREEGYRHVQGVDLSPQQIHIAGQVVDDVVHADVFDYLQGYRNQFDLLIALDLVEHLDKDEGLHLLDLCFRALKPGGRLILQTPNAGSPWGAQYRYADITHETAFTTGALSVALKLARFERIELREKGPIPWGYSLASTARYVFWQGIRLCLQFWNLVEMGSPGDGIYTRIFLVSAIKPKE